MRPCDKLDACATEAHPFKKRVINFNLGWKCFTPFMTNTNIGVPPSVSFVAHFERNHILQASLEKIKIKNVHVYIKKITSSGFQVNGDKIS